MARLGPTLHVQDKKQVSILTEAREGRVDYIGGVVAVADLTMQRLFNEYR